MRCNNIPIIVIPERKEEEPCIENLFEKVMAENFPNMVRESPMSPGSILNPNKTNPKRPTPRHIIINMAKFSPGWCGSVD